MENKDVGILLNGKNIKLHRFYFKQMCRMIGINTIYRSPLKNKHWDGHGELNSYFSSPSIVGCIFEEHPNQKSLKKLGWVSELQESSSIIHVPYDLKDLQVGSLFIIPSGLDNTKGRVFRVLGLQNIAVYPASIACEIAPVYESRFDRSQLNNTDGDMELLADEEPGNFMFLKEDKHND